MNKQEVKAALTERNCNNCIYLNVERYFNNRNKKASASSIIVLDEYVCTNVMIKEHKLGTSVDGDNTDVILKPNTCPYFIRGKRK